MRYNYELAEKETLQCIWLVKNTSINSAHQSSERFLLLTASPASKFILFSNAAGRDIALESVGCRLRREGKDHSSLAYKPKC